MTDVERVTDPFVPLMVIVRFPCEVDFVVVTVRVEDPAPDTDVGEKLHVAPEGQPVVDSATLPLKPFSELRVTV